MVTGAEEQGYHLFCSTSAWLVLDGSIDIFKHFHTLSAANKPQRHYENLKIPWERWESNPGLLGEKRKRYLCAMPPPGYHLSLSYVEVRLYLRAQQVRFFPTCHQSCQSNRWKTFSLSVQKHRLKEYHKNILAKRRLNGKKQKHYINKK